MDYSPNGFEDSLRTLFRRCVVCPDQTPTCPACADDEYCSQVSPTCTQCAARACVKINQAGTANTGINGPPSGSSSGGSANTGAIAGGAVGGVLFIALVTYLIWRFCIRNRRRADDDDGFFQEKANSISARNNRTSTHTVASMASTVMTRASNVIQIAFIPGITDRSQEPDHGAVPPVPAIPLQHQTNSPTSPYADSPQGTPRAHYFMPRDSTYTGISDSDSIRSSMMRQSVAPSMMRQSVAPSMMRQSVTPSLARQSYASTLYNQDAAVTITPAQTAYRGKANVVSVRPSAGSSPSGGVPEVPQVDYFKYNAQGARPLQRVPSMAPSIAPSLAPSMAPSIAASDTASMRRAIFSSTAAAAAGYPAHPSFSDEDKRKTTDSTRIAAAITAASAKKSPLVPQSRPSPSPSPGPEQRPLGQASQPAQNSPSQPQPAANKDSAKDPSPFSDENAVSR